MGQIKLNEIIRFNTYTATCDILLDGECIGNFDINYAYTPENKLRIQSFWVSFDKPVLLAAGIELYKFFEVDGTWEVKGKEGYIQLFKTEYKTAQAAKSAALAYITDVVNLGIFALGIFA